MPLPSRPSRPSTGPSAPLRMAAGVFSLLSLIVLVTVFVHPLLAAARIPVIHEQAPPPLQDPSASLRPAAPGPIMSVLPQGLATPEPAAPAVEEVGTVNRINEVRRVPDFTGYTLHEVREMAREQGIRVVARDDEGPLPRRGRAGLYDLVWRQSPAADEPLEEGARIRLEVENLGLLEGY